jgi:hypothetical protein
LDSVNFPDFIAGENANFSLLGGRELNQKFPYVVADSNVIIILKIR